MGRTTRVFLTDFGLAKHATTGSKYTRTGQALGTPAYMSPEQARGDVGELTPATDVWALGTVLYECLAGRPAFGGSTDAAILGEVMTRTPSMPAGIPLAVQDLLRGALHKSREGRFAAAGAFSQGCGQVLGGKRPSTPTPGRGSRWTLAVLGVTAVTVGVALVWPRATAPPSPTPAPTHDAEQWAMRGWSERHADPGTAILLLQRALTLEPARHDWRLQLGLLQWAKGDPELATRTWCAIPSPAPEATRAAWLRGLAAAVQAVVTQDDARWESAEREWDVAAAGSGAEAGWAQAALAVLEDEYAMARSALGNAAGWEAAVIRALLETSDPDGDVRRAIDAYTQVLTEGLPFPWAVYNRGLLHEQLGDREASVADLERALALQPDFVEAIVHRAILRIDGPDEALALAEFTRALAIRPDDPTVLTDRGILRARRGDIAGALEDLDRAVTVAPQRLDAWLQRAAIRQELGDLRGALADLDQAVTIDPANPGTRVTRALAHLEAKDWPSARADCEAAILQDPTAPRAHSLLGLVCLREERWAEAIGCFERVLALDPDPEMEAQCRQAIAACRTMLQDG